MCRLTHDRAYLLRNRNGEAHGAADTLYQTVLKGSDTPGSLRVFFVLFFSLLLPLGSHSLSPNHKYK